jgi:HEAT repeat protein
VRNRGKVSQRKYSNFWRRRLTRWLIARLRTKSVERRTYILQALGRIGDEAALPVILGAAKDTNSTVRRFAVSALADMGKTPHTPGRMGHTQAIDALIVALDDPETDIRATAAMSLGLLGDRRAESAIIALLNDEEASVRAQAIIALGHLGSSRTLPILNEMIAVECNEWMRRYISQAIREIEGGCSS